jgi:hypothetical protein
LENKIPNTRAIEVDNIFKAICNPATISLSTKWEILKKPKEPGTSNIIPGTSITEVFLLFQPANKLLTTPNTNDAMNTAVVGDVYQLLILKEKYDVQQPTNIHKK